MAGQQQAGGGGRRQSGTGAGGVTAAQGFCPAANEMLKQNFCHGGTSFAAKNSEKGRMERTAGKKKPLRTQGGGAESGTQNQGSGKTAAGLHTAPDRNAVCRNTAARQNPPVGAAARPNRRRPGDGAAGRSSGFGVRPLTAAAPRGNHTRLPYSPCGGQTAAGHLALVCGTEALRLKRPYNKPI